MKGLISALALAALLASACGGDSNDTHSQPTASSSIDSNTPPGASTSIDALTVDFTEPDSAVKKMVEYQNTEQWDLAYSALVQEHRDECPFEVFEQLKEQAAKSKPGRIAVTSVGQVRQLQEWQGFRDVAAVTLVITVTMGTEALDYDDTFHLVHRDGYYYWTTEDEFLSQCSAARQGTPTDGLPPTPASTG